MHFGIGRLSIIVPHLMRTPEINIISMKARYNAYIVGQDIKNRLSGGPIVAQILELITILLYKRKAMYLIDTHVVCNSRIAYLVVLNIFLCRK